MNIKDQLVVLSEICRQDLAIIELKDKLNKLGRSSQEATNAAILLKNSISSLNDKKTEALNNRRALDAKLQTEKANIRKWELRAEKIKGEREYTALISEIGTQKRTIAGLEAEINEVGEEIKSIEAQLLKASGSHDEKLSNASLAHESVKDLLTEEQTKLANLEQAKEKLLEKLPQSLRLRYQKIGEKRSLQGIAFLYNEVCQACRRTVPPELYIKVLKGEVIEQCPACLRLLVTKSIAEENGGN